MTIKLIKTFGFLKNHTTDLESVQNDILFVFEQVAECTSNSELYKTESLNRMEALETKTDFHTDLCNWVAYSESIYAAFLATKIYEDRLYLDPDSIGTVLEFFENGDFSLTIKTLGIYACAQLLAVSDPMKCYEQTMEVFTMNPNFAQILKRDYVFRPSNTDKDISKSCPICNSSHVRAHYCAPQVLKLDADSSFPPAKLWMKCEDCNNFYTYNFPIMEVSNINGHYTVDSQKTTLNNRFALAVYDEIFQNLSRLTSGRNYLEIGIGNGEMLALAQEFGFHPDAVEICQNDCINVASALNVDIKLCDIVDYNTDKKYDVIIMGDVLEHVSKPSMVLQKVAGMLAEDGVLWISTPNYNCAYARMQKFDHVMWHELNHYTYVSRESLETLLNGFGLSIVTYNISKRYVGSMELCIKKI